jgi:hypothetical protein
MASQANRCGLGSDRVENSGHWCFFLLDILDLEEVVVVSLGILGNGSFVVGGPVSVDNELRLAKMGWLATAANGDIKQMQIDGRKQRGRWGEEELKTRGKTRKQLVKEGKTSDQRCAGGRGSFSKALEGMCESAVHPSRYVRCMCNFSDGRILSLATPLHYGRSDRR